MEQHYEVVERSIRGHAAQIDWAAIQKASEEKRAVLIPLNGTLMSTMHSALHTGAKKRGFQAHLRSHKARKCIEVYLEPLTPEAAAEAQV